MSLGILAHHDRWPEALALCVGSQLYCCSRGPAIACGQYIRCSMGCVLELDVWVGDDEELVEPTPE